MYTFFVPGNTNTITIRWYDNGAWGEQLVEGRSKAILNTLNAVLAARGKTLAQVSGVGVVLGQGSFTATRMVTTLANTLAFAARTPIRALAREEDMPLDPVAFFAKPAAAEYISATYSGEAHIGK